MLSSMFDVLSKHRRHAAPHLRRVIADVLRRRVAYTSQFAYYYGSTGRRRWATSYLARLTLRHLARAAVVQLFALRAPKSLKKLPPSILDHPTPQEIV